MIGAEDKVRLDEATCNSKEDLEARERLDQAMVQDVSPIVTSGSAKIEKDGKMYRMILDTISKSSEAERAMNRYHAEEKNKALI